MRPRILFVLLVISLAIPLFPRPAGAAYPGFNGLIAYIADGAVYVVDPLAPHLGGDPLTGGSPADETPVWSPDGSTLAFTRTSQLWTMDADGTNEAMLLAESPQGITWSPDGAKLAYGRSSLGLYVVNANGTGSVQISSDTTAQEPSWSVGNRIVFTSSRDGNAELYAIDPDGTDEVRLTTNTTTDQQANWSPDGLKLAFATNRDGNFEIYSMKPDGTLVSRLTNRSNTQTDPAWSPDGLKITFTTSTDLWKQIEQMNNNGTNQTTLIDNGTASSESQPDWQPLAQEPPPDDFFDPISTISRPKQGVSYYQANIKVFSGTARDVGASGLARVEVALRRVLTDGNCLSWNGSVFVKTSCTFKNWRLATGKAAWTYTLPKGLTKSVGTNVKHYVLLSRATDVAGNVEVTFGDGRNRNRFEVV